MCATVAAVGDAFTICDLKYVSQVPFHRQDYAIACYFESIVYAAESMFFVVLDHFHLNLS